MAKAEEKENGSNILLSACKKTFYIHAPPMQNYARGNQMPFVYMALPKKLMTGT